MRLLSRKEINESHNTERKSEIDEGIKLARKIDILREAASKEESSLKIFREKSLSFLREETSVAVQERNKVLREIEILETEKKLLESHADDVWKEAKKRNHILTEGTILTDFATGLYNKHNNLLEREAAADKREVSLAQIEAALNQRESDLIKKAEIIVNNYGISEKVLKDVRSKGQNIEIEAKDRRTELDKREASLALKEREIDMKDQALSLREGELKDKEIQVNDKYKTLLRTMERINKK